METLTLLKTNLIFAELLAASLGLWSWRQLSTTWRLFCLYLCVVVAIETIARIIPKPYRTLLYSQTIPVHFLSFFYIFYHKLLHFKRWVLGCSTIYVLGFLLEIILHDQTLKPTAFMSFNYTLGNIILLLFTLFYFYEVALSERILVFYSERMFWVACGIAIYYLGTLPYFGLYNYLKSNHLNLMINYTWLVILLDYFMYLCFSISLLWKTKN